MVCFKNPKIEFKEAVNQTRRQNNVVEKDPHMMLEWMVKIKLCSRDSNPSRDTIIFIIIQIISIIIISYVFLFFSSSTVDDMKNGGRCIVSISPETHIPYLNSTHHPYCI